VMIFHKDSLLKTYVLMERLYHKSHSESNPILYKKRIPQLESAFH